jgi:SAM-dependent methyltransferase
MKDLRPCAPKSHAELALEWDRLAEERHRQIATGQDISFEHVLLPTTLRLFEAADASVVIDIGSGTGDLTAKLARIAARVIALEPSRMSVAVAQAICCEASNVRFLQVPLEEARSMLPPELATSAVASMTLMTTPDLRVFANALASLLQREAKFVATLSHPCFWPRYWGYEGEAWFNYNKEIFIEAPFVTSRCRTKVKTTHIHRPLEQYIHVFENAGFKLESLLEPIPSEEIQAFYPVPWRYPRFLGLRWTKAI